MRNFKGRSQGTRIPHFASRVSHLVSRITHRQIYLAAIRVPTFSPLTARWMFPSLR